VGGLIGGGLGASTGRHESSPVTGAVWGMSAGCLAATICSIVVCIAAPPVDQPCDMPVCVAGWVIMLALTTACGCGLACVWCSDDAEGDTAAANLDSVDAATAAKVGGLSAL